MTLHDTFLRLLRAALWGKKVDLTGKELTMSQYQRLMQLAQEQAVAGLIGQMLMDSGVRLPKQAAIEVYAFVGSIQQRNEEINEALVHLCQDMEAQHIRFVVFKGQTLARFYPTPSLRQAGDIDFAVHPDDWLRAIDFFKNEWQAKYEDIVTETHLQFDKDGVEYEIHRMFSIFTYPPHMKYWELNVLPGIWQDLSNFSLKGTNIPILSATHNTLYLLIHIFQHLISEGIGLRQFCDWGRAMDNGQWTMDNEKLKQHLEGLGLYKAYTGLGAILTDYIGLPEQDFPFTISADDHKRAPQLMENIWEMGNFGHKKNYTTSHGIRHGLEHLGRIFSQARQFQRYAPAEAWWRIPYMFRWWGMKLWRKLRVLSPLRYESVPMGRAES